MLTSRLRPAATASDPKPGGSHSPGNLPAPAPAGFEDVLDAEALARLRELDPKGENQLIQRVVKAFDGSVSRLLSQLTQSHQTADLNGVRHVAHTLKSSSASIGALKLSQICAEIESNVRQGKADGLDQRLAEMTSEIVRVQAALKRLAESES